MSREIWHFHFGFLRNIILYCFLSSEQYNNRFVSTFLGLNYFHSHWIIFPKLIKYVFLHDEKMTNQSIYVWRHNGVLRALRHCAPRASWSFHGRHIKCKKRFSLYRVIIFLWIICIARTFRIVFDFSCLLWYKKGRLSWLSVDKKLK